jgi:hypothetical protein
MAVILFILMLLFPASATAQAAGPQVRLDGQLNAVTVGTPWNIAIYVDHDLPDEVSVVTPEFAPSLYLDRYTKTPRRIGLQTYTVLEYVLIPYRSGFFRLEPFRITTPAGTSQTQSLPLNIRSGSEETRIAIPQLSWEGSPAQLAMGEQAIFSLRVSGTSTLPLPEFFMPEVPQGVILLSLPVSVAERGNGVALKLSLIPLLSEDFRLTARVLRYENVMFTIPALFIQVTERLYAENYSHGDTEARGHREDEGFILKDYDFNLVYKGRMNWVWREQCEDIYDTARRFWDGGNYTMALAELRQNERDHPAGTFLREIRREAEHALGIYNTRDESRWKRKLFLALALTLFFVVIISPFIYFSLMRKHIWKKAVFFACTIIFSVVGFVFIYLFMDSRHVLPGKSGSSGITTEIPVRRMADYEGQELYRFKEGQPVRIMLNSGSWLYVRSNDIKNASGWIPATAVIFY